MDFHWLKVQEKYWGALWHNCKRCEIRKHDRDYKVGDYIVIESPKDPTKEREFIARITHILTDSDFPDGLKPGYSALSISRVMDNERLTVLEQAKIKR